MVQDATLQNQFHFCIDVKGAIKIYLQTGDGLPLVAQEVAVTLEAPWLGIEPRTLITERLGNGLWLIPAIYFPAPGEWNVTIDAMVNDFERLSIAGQLTVHP